MLTKRSGALVEFQHVIRSDENNQENKEHLHCLSNCLKKLQSDINSCLTEIITTSGSLSDNSKGKLDREREIDSLFI